MNWIKVSDRLPEERQKVIASDGDYVGEYFFDHGSFETDEGYYLKATHWMPLPHAPKDECNCRNIGKNGMACDDTLYSCDKCKDE